MWQFRLWCLWGCLVLGLPYSPWLHADDMPLVRVGADGKSFVLAGSEARFVPWGFNYDHDPQGRLLEDYWHDEWATVVEDFREMKQLGANVVRIHLQLGRFMESASRPNDAELARLARLLKLAEELHIYLDITGLGCYHKQDVPAWYDDLSETQRWDAQARFWEAVAQRCADSPAVFCYDLMNEPVVPGGQPQQHWLGPAFAGKHFVQFITRDTRGRARPEVARQWIEHLVAAIRRHDRRHMITVGLVPWSLDRPGLTSGFDPAVVAGPLDFVAVHLYPEEGQLDAALETLRGFHVGKPVLVEEMFPLKCSVETLERFVDASRGTAAGWVGFYWGRTPQEYRRGSTIADAITLGWLELFQRKAQALSKPAED
jgi:hypothetical protein